jgi:DivIVA domain-containing protein
MEPEDIEGRDFFVGLRGYDRDEVNQFLSDVAAELRATRAEIEMLRNRPETMDPFEHLGSNVTAILRTANDTAEEILASAKSEAETVHARAEAAAEHVRKEGDAYAARVRDEVSRETDASRRAIDDARAEAGRIIEEARMRADQLRDEASAHASTIAAEAEARVSAIEDAAERAGRERATRAADELLGRLQEAMRQHEAVRARLIEAGDEVQLALLALGDSVPDPAQVVRDAALDVITLEDSVPSE